MRILGEVWLRAFSEIHVESRESFLQDGEYIAADPVKADGRFTRKVPILRYSPWRKKTQPL
jgi:hypothetical protein